MPQKTHESRSPINVEKTSEEKYLLLAGRHENKLWAEIIKPMIDNRKKAAFEIMVDSGELFSDEKRNANRLVYNTITSLEKDIEMLEGLCKQEAGIQ